MYLRRSLFNWQLLVYCFLWISACLLGCHSVEKKDAGEEKTQSTGTPVTLTTITTEPLIEYADLNATSAFLQKSYVKANVNGYITGVTIQPGKFVAAGQNLFTLKTKEAQSIGSDISRLDPSFKFSGVNHIKANGAGYITQLNHLEGDYVQDGEQLAVISDVNSFAFILNLPYDLKQHVRIGDKVDVLLPDGKTLAGTITSAMPTVDPASQTQSMVIKVPGSKDIPENLVAKVRIAKAKSDLAVSLPKAAVLTNDAQTDFWIMKLTDSNTAVKIPVKKGMETQDRIEITDPKLTSNDKILLSGNYGLPDTARVMVTQEGNAR